MIAYNAVQVGLCCYMAAEASRQFFLLDYSPLRGLSAATRHERT